jgi:hypothetical protein
MPPADNSCWWRYTNTPNGLIWVKFQSTCNYGCKCYPPRGDYHKVGDAIITVCENCTNVAMCVWQLNWIRQTNNQGQENVVLDWYLAVDLCNCEGGCKTPPFLTGKEKLGDLSFKQCDCYSPPPQPPPGGGQPQPFPAQPNAPQSWPVPLPQPGAVIAKINFTISGSPCDCLDGCLDSLSSCCNCCPPGTTPTRAFWKAPGVIGIITGRTNSMSNRRQKVLDCGNPKTEIKEVKSVKTEALQSNRPKRIF